MPTSAGSTARNIQRLIEALGLALEENSPEPIVALTGEAFQQGRDILGNDFYEVASGRQPFSRKMVEAWRLKAADRLNGAKDFGRMVRFA